MSETFRPKSNFVWAGVSISLTTLFAINSLFYGTSASQSMAELIACLILIVAALLIWVRPKLVLDDESVLVVNPVQTLRISYRDITEMDTKWSLTIFHTRGKTRVWVAPASGKRRWIADSTFGWYGSSVPLSETRGHDAETMSASLNSLSGQAAYMIRERMKRLH
jgi:hypothetical protein